MKVELLPPRHSGGWIAPGHAEIPIKKTVPFYQSQAGNYVHRIRSGKNYYRHGEYSHTAFELWCGMHGLSSDRHRGCRLFVEPLKGEIVCATCEGRAIGAGQTGSREICGHLVKFPRVYDTNLSAALQRTALRLYENS